MKMKPIAFVVAGMAAATLLSAPVYAAKVSLSDAAVDKISGKSNDYTFGSDSTAVIELGADASANIQFDWYQWSDLHIGDASTNKGANDQSGASSAVQQTVNNTVNSLIWGSAGQNYLNNSGSIGADQANMSYGVFAAGGF